MLVGRGDAENDDLTFRVAKPPDIWLHVAGGTPGSHVVIQNPEGSAVPGSVIEQAAALAAWYSKARAASRVEVHFCQASQVSKPRGAPPGLVQLARFESVEVTPAPCSNDRERGSPDPSSRARSGNHS